MKKFKVIEEGRILSNYALAQVQGGSTICIDASTYRICGDGTKTVCNIVEISLCMNKVFCEGTLKICANGSKMVCGGNMSIIVPG